MKELAIFYRDRENPRAIQYIEDNFYNILGDYINITNYYIDEMSDDQFINADVYIVCYEETLNHLVNRINDFSKVVVMTRCIQQQYLRPILEIPADTKVLVVNDSKESVLQTMYMIYELGIGHLSLIPFEESIAAAGGYADFDTAIVTCDSEHLIPRHIKNVYNIHNRDISFETFHKIISLLDLKNSYIQGNLLKKIREDMDTSISYIDSYLSNFLKDQMMNEIVDESSRAIVLLDAGDTIHYINEKAFGLFGANQGEKFAQSSFLPEELASAASFDGEMIVFGDNNYLAEKIDISLMEDSIGCCLIFQAEKDLRESESKLSRQLKQTALRQVHLRRYYPRFPIHEAMYKGREKSGLVRLYHSDKGRQRHGKGASCPVDTQLLHSKELSLCGGKLRRDSREPAGKRAFRIRGGVFYGSEEERENRIIRARPPRHHLFG